MKKSHEKNASKIAYTFAFVGPKSKTKSAVIFKEIFMRDPPVPVLLFAHVQRFSVFRMQD